MKNFFLSLCAAVAATVIANAAVAATPAVCGTEADVVFSIGTPDAKCAEFALVKEGYAAYPKKFANGVHYTVGKSNPAADWPFLHPSLQDAAWAKGGAEYPFAIHFNQTAANNVPLTLVLAYMAAQGDLSEIRVAVNGKTLPPQLPVNAGHGNLVHKPVGKGTAAANLFTLPADSLKAGDNTITITLSGKSWILYDYIALRQKAEPLLVGTKIASAKLPPKSVASHRTKPSVPQRDLLTEFRKDAAAPLAKVSKLVFAARAETGEHWYANFGYYADDVNRVPAPMRGGKLCIYDLDTKETKVLVDDATGAVRDPQVSYDGTKILFSYCPGGTKFFHLYEIGVDGKNLRQLTDGEFDDIEPSYIAGGEIIFVSTRAQRWVNCWLTQVAILYGCDADGKNIHPLSGNIEQDNTPWPLPNGQILYTRWEYVDRSQVNYHHLWSMNPDGTHQMVFYGNLHPGIVYIDSKPIPNSDKIVSIFSWGHGQTEHAGSIGIIDPRSGPDEKSAARVISKRNNFRDPWAFSENAFLAARNAQIVLMDGTGAEQTIFELPKEWRDKRLTLHEPRPIMVRQEERRPSSVINPADESGQLMLVDVYQGRNMEGVKRGEIKKLLIIESLPKQINYTGGMEPLSWGGTFTLERVYGTVPVDPDGSANFKLPALRSFFFVALDKDDLSVKRMQSFLSVMPGERLSCIGCHEERTNSPIGVGGNKFPTAFKRKPSPITPLATPVDTLIAAGKLPGASAAQSKLTNDVVPAFAPTAVASVSNAGIAPPAPHAATIPDVLDFPRDVQPILDRNCVACHNPDKREGHVSFVGNRTPFYSISYATITAWNLVADGRNLPVSNYAPRLLGTSASPLFTKYATPDHYNVRLTDREREVLRLWIETGAAYPGTYAGLGSGMIGGYAENHQDLQDRKWPETQAMTQTIRETCTSCHGAKNTEKKVRRIPLSTTDETDMTWWIVGKQDPRKRFSRQLLFDLTVPEKSTFLLAPLAKSAGGYESCGAAIFKDKNDPRFQTILAGIERAKQHLDTIKRFDMPGFQPRPQYIRELKKYGVLPASHDPEAPVNVYQLDQAYWRSQWYRPSNNDTKSSDIPAIAIPANTGGLTAK